MPLLLLYIPTDFHFYSIFTFENDKLIEKQTKIKVADEKDSRYERYIDGSDKLIIAMECGSVKAKRVYVKEPNVKSTYIQTPTQAMENAMNRLDYVAGGSNNNSEKSHYQFDGQPAFPLKPT
ncbi:hypothetical protein niasHT_021472 [Heterodera trifolii]|uniref:Uncharacterized protein n=1 Tax=Heterodera trifolii TaxID=157864 RepID=A0ABD2KJI8_9BILA